MYRWRAAVPGRTAMTLPISSKRMSFSPSSRKRARNQSARSASPNGGAATRARANCQFDTCSSCVRNHSPAARTDSRAANSATSCPTLACGGLRRGVKAIMQNIHLTTGTGQDGLRLFCGNRLAALQNFGFGQGAVGGFCPLVDTFDDVLGSGNSVLFQPEVHVRFSTHRADVDNLLQAEEMAGHARVHSVGQLDVVLLVRLDDRGGVHSRGRAERVLAQYRVVIWNGNAGRA